MASDAPTPAEAYAAWTEEDEAWEIEREEAHPGKGASRDERVVLRRIADGTFWLLTFRWHPDHGHRDGVEDSGEVTRVYPHAVTKTVYRLQPPQD